MEEHNQTDKLQSNEALQNQGCSCGHCHEEGQTEDKLWQLILGTIIFLITVFTEVIPAEYKLIFYVVAYLLLGNGIIHSAVHNIIHREMFDETLLMVIATAGAFAIGDYAEAVGVMLFNRVGEIMEERASNRSRNQIMQAVDMRPQTVRRINDNGSMEEIPAAEAMVGDAIRIRVGDRIPLDGVVSEGESLVDTSAITGEPVPVLFKAGDTVLSGGVNTSAVLTLRVTKVLSESMVTKILQSVEEAALNKPHMDRFISRFAHVYTPAVVAIAILTAIAPSLVSGQWHHWIYVALTFLVISCPCALVLSVPLSFFAGIGAGSKMGILFKGGSAMEMLSRIKTVVMDKTGTVTEGNFVVQEIRPAGIVDENEVLRLCASAEKESSHPIARSLVKAAETRKLHALTPTQVSEQAGKGIRAIIDDNVVLCGNHTLLEDDNIPIPEMCDIEYGTQLLVALNGAFIGSIIISDTIKTDAAEAIGQIHALNVKTAMLTGDSYDAAAYIAAKTKIDEVRAKLLPQDKVTTMREIREQSGAVLFVGDGINDAPVLAGADVGAAMGSGADAAVEAADIVFLNSTVVAIPKAIRLSRQTMSVAWQNIIFALFVKGVVLLAGFAGYASMWAAVFADTGVAMLCVMNSVRILYKR